MKATLKTQAKCGTMAGTAKGKKLLSVPLHIEHKTVPLPFEH